MSIRMGEIHIDISTLISVQTASDGPGIGIISDALVVDYFNIVNYVVFGSVMATFGIIVNILNITVFIRQGLNDSVNISLLGLAVSDLCSMVTLQWINLLLNPLFINSGIPLMPNEVQHLTGGWPHTCFTKITSLITVHITFERCLCVAVPFKVKRIITPRRTVFVMVIIYLSMFLTLVPEYATAYLNWKFHPDNNRTLLRLMFTADRQKFESLSFIISAVTQTVSYFAVILFTVILVVKVKQNSKWRRATGNVTKESSKSRDNRAIKTITLIAIIYIVCFIPSVSIYIVTSVEPEFNVVGRYQNAFIATWSFASIFHAFNSIVTIFVYYHMSCKYRATFKDMVMSYKESRNRSNHQ